MTGVWVLRLVLAVVLLALGVLPAGCGLLGSSDGQATREGERIIEASANQSTVAVNVTSLVGQWQTPEPNGGAQPARRVLSLQPDGTGTAWSFIDSSDVPGMSAPFAFTWLVDGDRIELRFDDGHTEVLGIDSLKPDVMNISVEGTATWATSAPWTRHSE